jgi:thymidylate kinase
VEGPCCAGKTTLAHELLRRLSGLAVAHVKCYADHVGGGRYLPRPVPTSLSEDRRGLRNLLGVEADRVAFARARPHDLILMDRSVHTLLGHRLAIERMTGLRCFATARRALARSAAPAWPDLVIYLDVPQESVHSRNHGKFAADSIFINAEYNAAFRAYFAGLTRQDQPRMCWLDATRDAVGLGDLAEAQIRRLLGNRDARETAR